jgi:hypothetical protein
VKLSCSPSNLVKYPAFELPSYLPSEFAFEQPPCFSWLPFDGRVWVSVPASGQSGISLGSQADCGYGSIFSSMVGTQLGKCFGDGCSFYQDIVPPPGAGSCSLSFLYFTTATMTLSVSFSGTRVISVVLLSTNDGKGMRRIKTTFGNSGLKRAY